MKKVLGIALVLALAVMLVPSAVFAAAPVYFSPTGLVIDWSDGSGTIGATVIGGDDAIASFRTTGSGLSGTLTADYTAGSYDYMEVNTLVSRLDALVGGGGFIQYQTQRTDCWGGWSPAGQVSNSFVGTGTFDPTGQVFSYGAGTASMGTGSTSHLNGLIDYNYPLNGVLGVSGAASYTIIRSLADTLKGDAGAGTPFAGVSAIGSGSATLNCRNSAIDYQFSPAGAELGGYSGCPPTASFAAQGSGTFYTDGTGISSVKLYNVTQTGNVVGSGGTWTGTLTPSGTGLTATSVGSGAAIHQWTSWSGTYNYPYYGMVAD